MNGIVVCPIFNRPAFLHVWVDYIVKATGADKMRYIFAADTGFDRRNIDILRSFPYEYAILERKTKIVGIGKQSNNVLMGMKAAYENCEGKPIYYVEDDVFIASDFFTMGADIINAEPDILCCILSKNVNAADTPENDLNGYYVKVSNEYQGIGSVFNPAKFNEYIMPHICTEYVTRPRDYCLRHFPRTTLGAEFCEQDGLIRRIIEANRLPVAFSCVPRCFHAGFFGYHRLTAKHVQALPLDRQIQQVYKIAFDVEELRKVAQAENLVYDSMPVNLGTSHEGIKRY